MSVPGTAERETLPTPCLLPSSYSGHGQQGQRLISVSTPPCQPPGLGHSSPQAWVLQTPSCPLQGPHTLSQTPNTEAALEQSKGMEGNPPTLPCLDTAILVQRSARRILSLV